MEKDAKKSGVVGEAKRRIQGIWVCHCHTVLKPRVLKFCLKMYRHAYIFYCVNLRELEQSLKGLKFPHWRLLLGHCSFLHCGCFTFPQCSKQDTQWHHSVSQWQWITPWCGLQHLYSALRAAGDRNLSAGTQLYWWSAKWEHPISVRARVPLSLSFLLLPSTATTSLLPFDHYKSERHWHWQWRGSSDSNDLNFAHIALFACSAIVPVLFLAFLWLRL